MIEYLDSPLVEYGLYFLMFVSLLVGFYFVVDYVRKYSKLRQNALDIMLQIQQNSKKRTDSEHARELIHGELEKKSLVQRVDEKLTYSRLRERYKGLNTELFLYSVAAVAVAEFIICIAITQNFIVSLGIPLLTVFAVYLVLIYLCSVEYKKVEKSMMRFINIIENYSASSDDLVTIIEQTARYQEEPLRTHLLRFVTDARTKGDVLSAIRTLQDNVEYKYFKTLIRNLEICSRFQANYQEIIKDSREIFQSFSKFGKEKKELYRSGQITIMALVFLGAFCIYTISGSIEVPGNKMQFIWESGVAGKLIIAYLIFCLVFSIYTAFFKNLKH